MVQPRKFKENEDDNNDHGLQRVSFMVDEAFSMLAALLRFLVEISLPFPLFSLPLSPIFPPFF